ncbi:MAG TPA: orotate phosphoribosyltransferase [Gemmatimonadaceae bacterium]
MDPRVELVRLLAERSVKFGEFTLSSGKRSDFYVDARLTTMSPEGLRAVGAAGLSALRESGWNVDSVGGLTMGADPVAYAIALASALEGSRLLRAFSVRKDVKAHGTRRRIEGPFRKGDRVVIVEDVVTTGASALAAAAAAEHEHATVAGVLAVLDREEGGRETIEARGYAVIALATAREVIQAARKSHSPA